MYETHGTACNFVHKRLFGAAKGFVKSGFNPLGAAAGFLGGGGGGGGGESELDRQRRLGIRPAQLRAQRRRGGFSGMAQPHLSIPIPPIIPCIFPLKTDPITGECRLFVGEQPGPEPGGVGGGNAVMGQYGAALVPDVENIRTLECLPGMVLGTDELCYNKRDLKNAERKWPKGRAPLLTGGERNCITKAAAAARKIQRTEKQLQKLGMLKKPSRRSAPRREPQRLLPAGPSIINVE